MLGKILVYSGFIVGILSTILYFLSYYTPKVSPKLGRIGYYVLTGLMVAIAMYLLSNILQHNFQFTYIWEYSSRELYDHFLVASFYSGQQGSFLLWGIMLTFVGFFIMPYAQKHGYESLVMGFYSFIVLFILVMLVFKSPFDYVWESYPNDVEVGFTPENGRGLNPILQNYWITIHPPILFLGYSLMSVPYVFAISGLIKGEYRNWIKVSMPWTLAGAGVLGLGLMLGGFWAYETLGWGGFWAWDPVENSSLVPWLVSVTLVHTMLVHKRTGGLVKTNFVIAVSAFLTVIYATFLTRSGVLGDTSVHSFVSPGAIIYNLLLIYMVIFFLAAVVALFVKLNKIPNPKINFSTDSREFFLSMGSIVLILITFVVFFGMSWPIFAEITGQTKAAVDPMWYNILNMPLAILIMLFNSFSLYLKWKKSDFNQALKQAIIPSVVALVATGLGIYFGINQFNYALLLFAAVFSIVINAEFVVKNIKKSPKLTGAYVSHIGLALLLLGALATGGYSEKEYVRLKKGETKSTLGYNISFVDRERIEQHWKDREKYLYHIKLEKDGNEQIINPIIYWSDFNSRQAPFFEPGIGRYAFQDIYAEPNSLEPYYEVPPIYLTKGEKGKFALDTTLNIQLIGFDMAGALSDTNSDDGSLRIAAIARISSDDFVVEDTLFTRLNVTTGSSVPEWKAYGDSQIEAGFLQLIPNRQDLAKSQAVIGFKNVESDFAPPVELFTIEVSTKPFINLVWIGTIFAVIGFFLSIGKNIVKVYVDKEVVDESPELIDESPIVVAVTKNETKIDDRLNEASA